MESTGGVWYPIYTRREEGRSITWVTAHHIKAVPGRQSAVQDWEWIADLLRHGLLKPSFIAPQPIRALRERTRYRKTLLQERAHEANRLPKVLEGANIKLAAVATDILGMSAREMLLVLIEGAHDLDAIARHARGRMRPKIPPLGRALQGHRQPQQRVVVQRILAHVDYLDDSIRQLQLEIDAHLKPYQEAMQLLHTMPGIKYSYGCRGDHRRDRHGHGEMSEREASRLVGRTLSREQAERWQTLPPRENQGQSLAGSGVGGGGLVHLPDAPPLSGGAISPACQTTPCQKSGRGRSS